MRRSPAGAQGQAAAFGHGLGGVAHQVEEDLLDLARCALDDGQLFVVSLDADAMAQLRRRDPKGGVEEPTEVVPGLTMTLHDAGHILGAAIVKLEHRDDERAPGAQQLLAEAYEQQGQLEKAAAEWGALAERFPDAEAAPEARDRQAEALAKAGRFDEAIVDARLHVDPVGADAGLTAVPVLRRDCALHRGIEVRIVEYQRRCMAS